MYTLPGSHTLPPPPRPQHTHPFHPPFWQDGDACYTTGSTHGILLVLVSLSRHGHPWLSSCHAFNEALQGLQQGKLVRLEWCIAHHQQVLVALVFGLSNDM